MKPKQIYWHFLQDDGKLRYGSNEVVKVKHTLMLPVDSKISMCNYGYHASKRAIDALRYAPGSIACIVTLHGKIEHGDDKSVAQGRTVLAMGDVTNVLWEMACWAAEQALLNERKNGKEPHEASWKAVETRRLWIQGKATDNDLSAAESAARSAAESAAWSAAESAARSAAWYAAESAARSAAESAAWSAAESADRSAAWYAARSAARYAAWSAAESAAWSAAESAAESAAWSAAESAAWSAARSAQNEHLEKLLKKHLGWED